VVAVELAHLVLVAHRDQPDPRVIQVLLDLRGMLVNVDQKALGVFRVLLVPLVLPEQMGNQGLRAIMVQLDPLALLDRRVLPDLQENVAPQVRMQLPLSSTSTSPRMRRPRLTVRRLMLKMHSDRQTRSRTVLGTTRQ